MDSDSMTDKERRWVDALLEVRQVLDKVGFPFFFDTGTLLGTIREKKFIPWDNDIDFGSIRTPDTHRLIQEASDILHAAGYSYARSDVATYFVKDPDIEIGIMFYEKRGDYYVNEFRKISAPYGLISHVAYLMNAMRSGFIVAYDGHSLGKKGRHMLLNMVGKSPFRPEKQFSRLYDLQIKEIGIPARFFDNLTTVNLYGVDYPAPSPPEEYLECRYGDWRTPVSKYDYFVQDRTIIP